MPVDWANQIGQTGLHVASLHGNLEAMQAMLEAGINVNITNQRGSTPLHFAANAHANAREACVMLLNAGADFSIPDLRGTLPYENAEDDVIR